MLSTTLLALVTITLVSVLASWAQGTYKTLYKFPGYKDESVPTGGLILDQAGNLYGTTRYGGASHAGTVFRLKFNPDESWTESLLYDFSGTTDGDEPEAPLVFDMGGNLYGTTGAGGNPACPGGCGLVFELSPSGGTWTESVLHSFTGTDGEYPASGLFDQQGNLYGTTPAGGAYGGGTVFKLTPNLGGGWTESVLHSFVLLDGNSPYAGLIFDQAGNLYGTTTKGGNANLGTVFQLKPKSNGRWTEKVLYNFCSRNHCTDGGVPWNGVILDPAGNLYGTTSVGGGGQLKYGTVFKLFRKSDGTWTEKVIHRFLDPKNGAVPEAGLTFDRRGNLYGTTVEGGDTLCNCGVVFKLEPDTSGGWKGTLLHTFHGHPGAIPFSGVIFDAEGNLYGTTLGNHNTNVGTVFEIIP
jgi:uncharacterized repeat protein (TIGR03803 family)